MQNKDLVIYLHISNALFFVDIYLKENIRFRTLRGE